MSPCQGLFALLTAKTFGDRAHNQATPASRQERSNSSAVGSNNGSNKVVTIVI